MKFRYSPVALAVFAAVGSVTVTPATAQQAQPQALERVTITGSNIRRTDQETVAPVEIITREAIERTGSQTVADVLTKIPQTGSGQFNETANSFSPGTTSVSLRSLGQKATLVLLNGRRVAGYGFAQNISDTFVDLSQIPTAAVDRIEILLDGASAIYGSDAIAGVINVILRRDYQGIDLAANVGFYQGKNDYRATITGGYGDLGKQKFNVMGVLDYYKRDGLTMADTDFGATRDFRGEQGGRNFQSATAGGTWSQGNNRRAYAECPNPTNYQGLVNLGLLPLNQINAPLGTGQNLPGNTWCPIDFASVFQVMPDQEKIAFLGRGTYEFSATTQAYGELGYTHNTTDYIFQQIPITTTRYTPVGGNLSASPFSVRFAPGAGGNPLGNGAAFNSVYKEFGPRTSENTADAFRILTGVKYSSWGWDFDSAAWYSQSKVSQDSYIALTNGVIAGLGITSALQPPTPVTTNSPYNFNQPSLTQGLRDVMTGTVTRESKSSLTAVDTRGTTELNWMLPGGPAGLALGAEWRQEKINDNPDPQTLAGNVLGQGSVSVNGSRRTFAMYGELGLPLLKNLEAQLALRYDHYSDFGDATTPKVGVKWKPTNEWLLRANWGRGFKAPSLPEITPSTAYFFTTLFDPNAPGGGANVQTAGSISSNPGLSAEESRSVTAGVIFEPNASFSAGANYYDIKWTNQVAFPNFQQVINENNPSNVLRDPAGTVYLVIGQYLNLSQVTTNGVDLDAHYRWNTNYGRMSANILATYIDSYKIDGVEMAGSNFAWVSSNISAIPRWKGQMWFDWTQGPWVAQLTVNYTGSYWRSFGYDEDFGSNPTYFVPGTASGIPQTGQLDKKSPSYTTFDLYAKYSISPNFNVFGSIVNLLDKEPLYDPSFSTTYFYDRNMYDIRGRIFRIGANYKF